MQKIGATLNLSAGDLVGHLNCRYLTELDLKVANGVLEKPKIWDPVLETLAERGALHEQGFIEHIKSGGLAVTVIDGVGVDRRSIAATSDAMARGEPIIVQGALQAGCWNGRADVLRRVDTPSHFGAWSYEVIDTKLARETKGNTILQMSLYSDLLSETQGASPVSAFVVTPGTNYSPEAYRIADYSAYYRHVRGSLERSVSGTSAHLRPQFGIILRRPFEISSRPGAAGD
jgi:predicted RecB family nuclease